MAASREATSAIEAFQGCQSSFALAHKKFAVNPARAGIQKKRQRQCARHTPTGFPPSREGRPGLSFLRQPGHAFGSGRHHSNLASRSSSRHFGVHCQRLFALPLRHPGVFVVGRRRRSTRCRPDRHGKSVCIAAGRHGVGSHAGAWCRFSIRQA